MPLAWGYRLRLDGAAGRSGAGGCGVTWPPSTAAAVEAAAPVVRVALAGTGTAAGAGFRAECAPGLGVQTSTGRRGGPLWSRWLGVTWPPSTAAAAEAAAPVVRVAPAGTGTAGGAEFVAEGRRSEDISQPGPKICFECDSLHSLVEALHRSGGGVESCIIW